MVQPRSAPILPASPGRASTMPDYGIQMNRHCKSALDRSTVHAADPTNPPAKDEETTMDRNERPAFLGSSVSTLTPNPLLVMLYDRLALDVQRGVAAIKSGDGQESHTQLAHAQAIVMELHSSLDAKDEVGGPGPASLYDRLHAELIKADLSRDAGIALRCLGIVTDLGETLGRAATTSFPETAAAS